MSARGCTDRWCTRPADIKVGDLILCARHYKAHAGWERPTTATLLDGLRKTREGDQRARERGLLGVAR